MRKTIPLQEGIFTSNSLIKSRQRSKIMNEILYLLRKLTKLARRAQSISENVDNDLLKELKEIEEEVNKIENELC